MKKRTPVEAYRLLSSPSNKPIVFSVPAEHPVVQTSRITQCNQIHSSTHMIEWSYKPKFTFLSSLQIPPEQVCLQLEQSSELVKARDGSTLFASGHNFEVKNESLLHLGNGVPSI